MLTCAVLVADWLPSAKAPQILLVNSSTFEMETEITDVIEKYCSLYKVKARNLTKDHLDMAIEVKVKEEALLVTELMGIENIVSASLIAHDGEVTF